MGLNEMGRHLCRWHLDWIWMVAHHTSAIHVFPGYQSGKC